MQDVGVEGDRGSKGVTFNAQQNENVTPLIQCSLLKFQ